MKNLQHAGGEFDEGRTKIGILLQKTEKMEERKGLSDGR